MFVMFYQTRMVYFLSSSPYPSGHFVYSKDPDKTGREGTIINGEWGVGVGGVHRFSVTGHKGYNYGLKWF